MTDDLAGRLVACPACSARIRVRPEHDGARLGCPRCGLAFDSAPLIGSGSGEIAAASSDAPETTGHLETSCPDCGAGLRVRARYLGRHVRCGGCRAKFRVEPARASVLDAPAAPAADLGGAPTPDPDDPRQGRIEVMRLLGEIAELKTRNARLAANAERLRRERDSALGELAGLRDAAIPFDRGDVSPFAYFADVAGASGG